MVSLRPLAAIPVVGLVADGRTYRHLLYLFVSLLLWGVYSTLLPLGILLGAVLSVVLVGVAILVGIVIGSRLLASFERWLANRLLGTDLVAPDDVPSDATGAVAGVRGYLVAPSTWRGLGFVSLKVWVALLAFVPLFVLASALPLVAAPVRYPYEAEFGEANGEPVTWAIDAAPEAALAAGLGVVGVLVGLHLTNLIAGGARLMAVALLGTEADDRPDAEAANGGVAREAGTGANDGDDERADDERSGGDGRAGGDSGGDGGDGDDRDGDDDADEFRFGADRDDAGDDRA